MRQVTKKGLITVAAAGGLLALSGGTSYADSNAEGGAANSPGVGSGNSVQVPVEVPVNLCGNTVNVVGVLNPAFGNNCANVGHGHGGGGGSGAHADAETHGSPGVISGNSAQVPVNVPVNACGNSVSLVGLLSPVFGNSCVNGEQPQPDAPQTEQPETLPAPVADQPLDGGEPVDEEPAPADTPVTVEDDEGEDESDIPQLAATGGGLPIAAALPMGAGLLIGGVVLYRRGRMAHRG
ncbi:chaplin [Streptomyces litchfieldiae]|uniref:Chaplin n=1 Tax=Streptomyces litchfieldiae TaxID=3075543 RepID=A0ABU2MW03_9ACTN|nr:chaplin [Streptomyces sp. DSM 44938]MDT0345700.1 chaplin [Streptomyces sp. DSM 44938]